VSSVNNILTNVLAKRLRVVLRDAMQNAF